MPTRSNAPVAAIYTRVSTGAQAGEEHFSLATQEAACREYCAAHALTVSEAHVYREVHSGGELWERGALTALRASLRRREFGTVVVYALDRLSRKQTHIAIIADECERAGVSLLFVTETFEDSATGAFLRNAKAFAAELEREKIRERSMRGKRARIAAGKVPNYGMDLYGYRRDRAAGVRVIHEPEAAVVRDLFAWVAAGASLHECVRRLVDAGTPPPGAGKVRYTEERVRRWGTSSVARILDNPAYRGEGYALRIPASHRAGSPGLRPREEWVRLPDATTPAIVSPALWAAAARQRAANRGAATRNRVRPALLRGRIRCARCGGTMSPETDRNGHRIYRCTSRQKATGACGNGSSRADHLEPAVWAYVAALIRDPALLADARRQGAPATPDRRGERARAVTRVERITARQSRLIARYGDSDSPDFPWEVVEQQVLALQRERAHWQDVIAALDAALPAPPDPAALDDEEWRARVTANLDGLDFAGRRLALDVLGVCVHARGREWWVTLD